MNWEEEVDDLEYDSDIITDDVIDEWFLNWIFHNVTRSNFNAEAL